MHISIATATFHDRPFLDTLSLIKEAGFSHIELDIFWQGGDWKMAQHLEAIEPKDVLAMISDSGLKIASIHDAGGVIEGENDSIISESLFDYISHAKERLDCVVLHAPHVKTSDGELWWENYRSKLENDLNRVKPFFNYVCIENLPNFHGYYVSLTDPLQLDEFCRENDVFINLDTTHYAQNDYPIMKALDIVGNRTKAIHLSDYLDGKAHQFIGTGNLPLVDFIGTTKNLSIHTLTLECEVRFPEEEVIPKLTEMKKYVECAAN